MTPLTLLLRSTVQSRYANNLLFAILFLLGYWHRYVRQLFAVVVLTCYYVVGPHWRFFILGQVLRTKSQNIANIARYTKTEN